MTIELKGFVTISDYVSNVPGVISPVGELSTWSMTYAKEKGEYTNATYPGQKLYSFDCIDTDTAQTTILSNVHIIDVMGMVRSCRQFTAANVRPYDRTRYIDFLVANAVYPVTNVDIGEFVNIGTVAYPSWIKWQSANNNLSSQIWLADAFFREEYPKHEVTVVPYLPNVDDFFRPYNGALAAVRNTPLSELTDRIQAAKDEYPPTYLRSFEFNFVNQANPDQYTPVSWPVLIYGKAGDNMGAVIDAIVNQVLATSTHPLEDWQKIFPDIFEASEFFILPKWDEMAIENLNNLAGVYNSIAKFGSWLTFMKTNLSHLGNPYIEEYTTVNPHDWKYSMMLMISSPANGPARRFISDIYSDYIPVNSMSVDFNRMKPATRAWSLAMQDMLSRAEILTINDNPPPNMTLDRKEGVDYLVHTHNGVKYNMALRSNDFYNI